MPVIRIEMSEALELLDYGEAFLVVDNRIYGTAYAISPTVTFKRGSDEDDVLRAFAKAAKKKLDEKRAGAVDAD